MFGFPKALVFCTLLAVNNSSVNAAHRHRSLKSFAVQKEFQKAMKRSSNDLQAKEYLLNKFIEKATPIDGTNHQLRKVAQDVEPEFMQRQLWNDDDKYDGFGFHITNYSLRYVRCQMIEAYSDEAAESEEFDSVLIKKSFAIFRLCPTEKCSANRQFGCSSDYGEYMVELQDYLDLMVEYEMRKQEDYCDYCNECIGWDEMQREQEEAQNQQNNNNNNGRRLEDAGDNNNNNEQNEEEDNQDEVQEEQQEEQQEQDNEEEEQEEQQDNDDWVCPYYDECYSNFESLCVEQEPEEFDDDYYDHERVEEVELDTLFQCSKVDINYDDDSREGFELYIGPQCASDNFSIEISVFTDEFCSDLSTTSYDIESLTGVDLSSIDISTYYDSGCMSCEGAEGGEWYQQDINQQKEYAQNGYYNNNNNNNYDNNNGEEVNEICQQLYENAAKCNQYMTSYSDNSYQSNTQALMEKKTCTFIKNVVDGDYDQEGKIRFDNSLFNAVTFSVEDVSDLQIAGIIISLLAVVFLTVYACQLRSMLQKDAELKRSYYYGGQMRNATLA